MFSSYVLSTNISIKLKIIHESLGNHENEKKKKGLSFFFWSRRSMFSNDLNVVTRFQSWPTLHSRNFIALALIVPRWRRSDSRQTDKGTTHFSAFYKRKFVNVQEKDDLDA